MAEENLKYFRIILFSIQKNKQTEQGHTDTSTRDFNGQPPLRRPSIHAPPALPEAPIPTAEGRELGHPPRPTSLPNQKPLCRGAGAWDPPLDWISLVIPPSPSLRFAIRWALSYTAIRGKVFTDGQNPIGWEPHPLPVLLSFSQAEDSWGTGNSRRTGRMLTRVANGNSVSNATLFHSAGVRPHTLQKERPTHL